MEDHTMSENKVIYQARLHWVLFVTPILLCLSMLYLGLSEYQFRHAAFFVAFFAMVWGIIVWLTYHFSFLIVKEKQVILCTGILVRQTLDIPLSKIESIDIRQSIIGSLLHYGSLVITGTGGTQQSVHYLDRPLTCRRYIEQVMHSS
jgi:uncharacterized membrane protein YdbT with pleckstrin-like domain